jgi:hypothetical protein
LSWEVRIMAKRVWVRMQREVTPHSEAHSILGPENILDSSWCLGVHNAVRIVEDQAIAHMSGFTGID